VTQAPGDVRRVMAPGEREAEVKLAAAAALPARLVLAEAPRAPAPVVPEAAETRAPAVDRRVGAGAVHSADSRRDPARPAVGAGAWAAGVAAVAAVVGVDPASPGVLNRGVARGNAAQSGKPA
jgi:hypothetical protein